MSSFCTANDIVSFEQLGPGLLHLRSWLGVFGEMKKENQVNFVRVLLHFVGTSL